MEYPEETKEDIESEIGGSPPNNEQSEYDAEQFRDFIVRAFVELLQRKGVDQV